LSIWLSVVAVAVIRVVLALVDTVYLTVGHLEVVIPRKRQLVWDLVLTLLPWALVAL
jgi:hypothetical protein